MRVILLGLIALVCQGQTIHCGAADDQYFTGGAKWPSPVLRYGTFVYQIPASPGEYRVHLTFIEPSVAIGQRLFDVSINGVPALAAYDVTLLAGGVLIPIEVVIPVTAARAGIAIQFVTRLRNAIVSTIVVESINEVATPRYVSGLAAAMAGAGGGGIAVLGVTSTQAIVSYNAAALAGACTVEVSESATYKPLVHDVDPVLFPGADQDLVRTVVIGKRRTDTGADGNNYSRALQANTKHYVRITCGPVVQTLQFSTSNIPTGVTFNDGPQVDREKPGQWKMPTLLEDRAQTIIDPQTGALLHAVSLAGEGGLDRNFNGIFLSYGGFVRMCDPKLTGPAGGPLGFACTFLRYGQGAGVAYWIVPSTGEVRLLGSVPITGGGAMGSLVTMPDGSIRTYGPDNSGNTIWENYTGNFVSMPAGDIAVDGWHTYSSVPMNQMMQAFDPTFDTAKFGCQQPWAGAGQYVMFYCGSGQQDTEGWVGILYGGDGRAIAPGCTDGDACPRVVAAVDIFTQPATLNCTLHNTQQMGDVISINVQTLTYTGPQRCAAMGNMVYWRFKTDPHGTALVVDRFFDGGGHWDFGPLGRVTENGTGWGAVVGAPPSDFLNKPYSVGIDDSPFFAGARGLSWASTTSKHPSYHQVAGVAPSTELGWLLDMLPFDGGQFYSPASGATPISGQLYKYNLATEQSSTAQLNRKQLATLAISGGRSLIDISGPGSKLGDTAADSFKYCVALVAGECRQSSAAGDIFVNAPGVKFLQCKPADGPNPQDFDLCIGNLGGYQQTMVQVDLTGKARPRVITGGLSGMRNSFFYSTAKSLPDASWALFNWGVVQPGFGNLTNVWMAKLPPYVDDKVDRSTFVRMPVELTAPAGLGVVTAAVEFGYLEQGLAGEHFCTSRREACIAAAATFTDALPFLYASEGVAGVPCSSSCTVTVPVVPGHVVYFRPVFFNQPGKQVATGTEQVSVR